MLFLTGKKINANTIILAATFIAGFVFLGRKSNTNTTLCHKEKTNVYLIPLSCFIYECRILFQKDCLKNFFGT